jgi:hypothetical protein
LQIISQKKIIKFVGKNIVFSLKICFFTQNELSEVHIMQTKHFISPSVTVFRETGHKNSENTHIEKMGFWSKLIPYQALPGNARGIGYIKLKLIP